MIEPHEVRAMLRAACAPIEFIAHRHIDPALESIPPRHPIRQRVEAAVEVFHKRLRELPDVVAQGAPYATKEAAGEALRLAVADVLDAARDAIWLCEQIGEAINAQGSSSPRQH